MSTMYVNNIAPLEGNTINVASGNTLNAPGHVIQVQSFFDVDLQTLTANTSFTATNCAINFTPKFSNSKIIIRVEGFFWAQSANTGGVITLYRNGVNLHPNNNYFARSYTVGSAGNDQQHVHFSVYDTANTTSQIEYRAYIKMVWGSGTIQFGSNDNESHRITVMEIAQ